MIETLKVLHYKAGYEVRTNRITGDDVFGGDPFTVRSAFTPGGDYIGNPRTARFLVVKRGIVPEKINASHNICSVGFCEAENKWHGWSHRAIVGFGVGDKLFEERFEGATDETPFVRHGDITIESMEQARQAASNFADYVA